MKKLSLVFLLSMAFMAAGALKWIGKNIDRNRQKASRAFQLKKRIPSSCLVPPAPETYSYDIPPLTGWGTYHWKINTQSDSAQFYFNQGINMYYAFHTVESRASFLKATRFDSTNAMIWYGLALALGPTINYGDGYRAANDALEAARKSKKYADQTNTAENGLIDAIQVRYSPDTTANLVQLQDLYIEAMKKLAERYPKNAEVITLYADAQMLKHPWDLYDVNMNPKPWTPLIEKTLEQALILSPSHPGANHYMIHTREGSTHPERALASAEMLVNLMPDVAHITHMPSHIFIRTGNYQKGIVVNDDAVKGYDKYLRLYDAVESDVFLYQFHAIHMNMTCAMMAGNYSRSIQESNKLKSLVTGDMLNTPLPFGAVLQYVYSSLLFTQVRFGNWDQILTFTVPDSVVYASLLLHFAKGMAYAHLGKMVEASGELKILEDGMQLKLLKEPPGPFSSPYDALLVADNLLAGTIAEQKKDLASAINDYQKAVVAEDHIIYNEPRDWLLPARQYLGNAYLKSGEYTKAIEVFEKDLIVNPKNGWSLTGLKIAYEKTGQTGKSDRLNKELADAWQIKDVAINAPVF